ISLLLNITADHLDRYENNLEKYAASKFRIAENQEQDDWMIYHGDDPVIGEKLSSLKKKDTNPNYLLFHPYGKYRRELLYETERLSLN
ncbi:MAG TPA: Mur ligase family protein, partial [Balneolaceae bacterium]|nr:Mur ligase family protein [Balneolaceae bacterium]